MAKSNNDYSNLQGKVFKKWLVKEVLPTNSAGQIYCLLTCTQCSAEKRYRIDHLLHSGPGVACSNCVPKSPEYLTRKSFHAMRDRCLNTKHHSYPQYGGKGVKVCPEWEEYKQFVADLGYRPSPEHSIERIDNSKGYEPSNCRWATKFEQAANKRSNNLLTHPTTSETHTLTEWARLLHIPRTTLAKRLKLNWSLEEALKPTKPRTQNNSP